MANHVKPIVRCLAQALSGAAAVMLTAPALAQQETAKQEDPQKIERIEVTGSLFKVIEGETALPITILRADDLAKSGVTNAEQMVQFIAQNQSVAVSATSQGAGTGFASYANLRSLGSSRTLVLLNGKRVVNNPYQSLGVDLGTIPLALIERIEVLTDGASATYGTDAIAGVINFITKRELIGLTLQATEIAPGQSGGGGSHAANVAGGFGSLSKDGWNLYGAANWRKIERLDSASRSFASTTFIPERGYNRLNATTFPANYSQTASGLSAINPTNPGCQPPYSLFGDGVFGPRSCGYDFAPVLDAIPQQEQLSFLAKGAVALGSHKASVEYLLGKNDLTSGISPPVLQGLTMTSVNPYYPGRGITPGTTGLNSALPISLNWRVADSGRSVTNARTSTDRLLAQLEGQLANWDYQLWALESSSTVRLIFDGGFVNVPRIREGILGVNGAPFLNPFGAQSAAGLQFILDNRLLGEAQRAKSNLVMTGAQVSREVMDLPAGPMSLALAVEYKKEDSEFRNNLDIVRLAIGSGLELSQDVTGDRHSASLAAEASIPVIKGMELGVSTRYDKYSDFGGTNNPKVSLRYEPFGPVLLLRGSYNTGFRAPTLYDIFQPNTLVIATTRNNDPVLCPGGTPSTAAGAVGTRDCNIQFPRLTGGNQSLDAEESKVFTIGALIQATQRISFGVDYWNYHVQKTISALAEAAVFGDPVKYASLIVRCSQAPASQRASLPACGIPGGDPIAYFVNTTLNLGDTKTSGFDFTAVWNGEMTPAGRVRINYRGTYVSKYDFQREPGGTFFSRAGVFFDGTPVIRYTHVAAFNWDRASWATQLLNRYKSGYTDCNAQCGISPQYFNNVGAYSVWDLAVTYSGFKNLSITAGVTNLLNTDPPFTNKKSGLGSGYDERFADALGRAYVLSATYKF